MQKMRFYFLTFLLSAAFMAPFAEAGGKGERGGWMREQKEMFEKLDLTDAQRTQLKEIRKGGRDKMKGLRKEAKAGWKELREGFRSDTSEDELRNRHKKFVDVRNRIASERFESILAIHRILTPEQRKKLSDLKDEQRKKHGHSPEGEGDAGDEE